MTKFDKKTYAEIQKTTEALSGLHTLLQESAQEARDYFEDGFERWQVGEAGTAHGEWADLMEDLANAAESLVEDLEGLDVSPS